ncbi:MAG TPA: hypothetical protein VFC19_24160 [Candidatus Limnocylindrales bacterium]|nr:hypothetical protein [Candidatus Limnocylindrales bacterium]
MRHPTDGTLRRLVDEPAGVADADREHVANCPVCLSGLAAAQRDAALTGAALHLDTAPDVDTGWRRLSRSAADERPRKTVASTTPAHRWRAALRSPVLAVAAVVALLVGASAAAATDWLQIFHTERIAPVAVPDVDLAKLPELDAFGELKVTEEVSVRQVADAAEAQRVTGLAVPQVSGLPRGVTGEPTYHVVGKASAEFTFSAAKAVQFAASAGGKAPPPPAGLDGSKFRLVVGPGLAAVWAQDRPVPAMVVGRVTAPTVFSSGIPFPTARDYLLSLPGLPGNVASQLRNFSSDGTTLPLFIPADEMTTSSADISGVPATVLTSKTGVMAAVVWVDKGVVTAVAGSMSADEVLSVARGLRWSR